MLIFVINATVHFPLCFRISATLDQMRNEKQISYFFTSNSGLPQNTAKNFDEKMFMNEDCAVKYEIKEFTYISKKAKSIKGKLHKLDELSFTVTNPRSNLRATIDDIDTIQKSDNKDIISIPGNAKQSKWLD